MSSSDESDPREVFASLADLKSRVRALQEDKEHCVELEAKANTAFESHRVELTQLLQKERAVFTANEDRLRGELQSILAANRALMEQLDTQRRRQEEELKEELFRLRRHSMDKLAGLQEELDEARKQRHAVDVDVMRVAAERERGEEDLLQISRAQAELHNSLQRSKHMAQEEWNEARMAAEATGRRGGCGSECGCGCATCAGWGRRATPGRLPRSFIPSGPKGRHVSADEDGDDGGARIARDGGWSACGRRCGCSPGVRRGRHFSPSSRSPVYSMQQRQPATHNAQAMLSAIERGNYLRPRRYLQRGGCDGDYEVPTGLEKEGRWADDHRTPPPPPPGDRLEEMRWMHLSSKEAARAVSPVLGVFNGPTSPPRPPPPAAGDEGRASPPSHSPPSERQPPQEAGGGGRGGDGGSGWRATGSPPRSSRQMSPPPPPPPTAGGGRALRAACDTIHREMQGLREDYMECQRRLRDPGADSVEASKDMRRILAVMDRKADQLRAIRSEQRLREGELYARDVLHEVMRENRYCEGVYRDMVSLVRS